MDSPLVELAKTLEYECPGEEVGMIGTAYLAQVQRISSLEAEVERLRGLLESLIAYRDHNPRAFVGFSLYPKEWLRVEEALEAVAPKESASREERDDE